MRKPLFIAMLHIPMLSIGAQCTRNAEKDRYGPVTVTATTTTDSLLNRTTIDMRGHATGPSLKSSSCHSTTTGSSCWKLSVSR